MKLIYLDYAAAAPTDPAVRREMNRAMVLVGNPSSFNDAGRQAQQALAQARKIVADFLGARLDEIVFTASGSEANNLAIIGTCGNFSSGKILTTPIEHPSVLEPIAQLKALKTGYLKIDQSGAVDLKALEQAIKKDCRLISIMYANNEIGTLEPIRAIAKIIKSFNKKLETENWKLKTGETRPVLFHIDACQAAGYLDMNVQHLGVDLLTFNGSKIGGPRGVGVLYVRRGTPIHSIISGGGQERGLRAGTENLQAIVGLAKAVSILKPTDSKKIAAVRDYAIELLRKEIPGIILNGPTGDGRLPNNINICVPDLESEVILIELDKYGIAAGSGSACTSHAVEPSHVLKAIGVPKRYINGALRFSIGKETTKKDMDYLVASLKKIIPDLRKRYRIN